MHRRVGGQPPDDPALAGRIAGVIRDGYLDVEANSPLAPAEVAVFGDPAATATPTATTDRGATMTDPQGIFGIDLGTTYSVVGYIDETGRPRHP